MFKMYKLSLSILKTAYYLSLSYAIYLMILITVQYIPIRFDVAFLNIKQEEIVYTHYKVAFFSHVYTSIFALICGVTQFSKFVRNKFPKTHRALGKAYIGIVLLVASPSGLVMAFYANGGSYSKISFLIQAVLWFLFTYKAFAYAKNLDWLNHQKFMIRSYALTLSAISLRLFKWIIISSFHLPPMDTYKIVSWAGWLINIAIVEIYIFTNLPSKRSLEVSEINN